MKKLRLQLLVSALITALVLLGTSSIISVNVPAYAAQVPKKATIPTSALSEGDVIYQVLVDRFSDGDPSNNNLGDSAYRPNDLGFYHGGDWKGLTNKLDYISNLGVTAIWISPVSEQEPLSKDGKEGSYHGYFTKNYSTPNRHFGDKAELQALINQAHSKGLKMILDVVPNHTADYMDAYATSYKNSSYQPAKPLNNPGLYNHNGDCKFDNTETQQEIEQCDLGGLDDLNQNNPFVSQYLINTYKDWINMGFDGVRVDAARSIPKPWLHKFEQETGVPSFGEVFVGDIDYVSEYQKYQWGVLDFPYFFTVRQAFSADTDMHAVSNLFSQDNKYVNPNRLETFLDNHDRARFLTWANDDYQRLRSALTFLMTTRGVPVIYYGTEQADDGNGNGSEIPIANKDNRKDMVSFDQNAPIYKHIKRLNEIKKHFEPLRTGIQREMWVDNNVYAFSRIVKNTDEEAITVASNSTENQIRTIPLRSESKLAVGTTLVNQINTTESVTVEPGGITGKQIRVNLNPHDTKIFTSRTLSSYIPAPKNLTKLRVHANPGANHNIAFRGTDYPLSWNSGRAATKISSDIWEYQIERIPAGKSFEFKPLIDDKTWSVGMNYTGKGGETIDIYPQFR